MIQCCLAKRGKQTAKTHTIHTTKNFIERRRRKTYNISANLSILYDAMLRWVTITFSIPMDNRIICVYHIPKTI